MIDKAHLQGKNVGVRINGLAKTVPATVSYVENDGLWLVGQDLIAQIAASPGGLPGGLKPPPAVYVPFSQILWLIATNE